MSFANAHAVLGDALAAVAADDPAAARQSIERALAEDNAPTVVAIALAECYAVLEQLADARDWSVESTVDAWIESRTLARHDREFRGPDEPR